MSNAIVIGGGVVGLAIARQLARSSSRSVMLLEKNAFLGQETTSRNSGVIHSGKYYTRASLKALLCVEGRQLLYDYIGEKDIRYSKCQKLIVATREEDVAKLDQIQQNALNNGMTADQVVKVSGSEARAMEPNVVCKRALLSTETGIIDVHHLVENLEYDCLQAGVDVVNNCSVTSISHIQKSKEKPSFQVHTSHGSIDCDILINSAGLYAPFIANSLENFPRAYIPKYYYGKGNYFKLRKSKSENVFDRLIYPVPFDGGLGIHSTLDIDGNIKFGPDCTWLQVPAHLQTEENMQDPYAFHSTAIDMLALQTFLDSQYNVDESTVDVFYSSIREYYPSLNDGDLMPDYAGLRPKLVGPGGGTFNDFNIQCHQQHQIPGLVNLFGVESPGLTSCLSIAKYVSDRVDM
jgi:L-2-hydroxyglutarate oxidase LhgO